ncbi:hypothetical protein MA16_Dca005570 [Dendrobium catenatum]|uniref:Vacuolar protein sorting-associated protein 54 N-terminal domain-containing protein n=1 Tax=Dendrobium catenatum TaxID=906689 RepID=A0A2I0WQ08_9ASPA|nr:hypothetical protein MA16_Dca005570 [Dendrobium catenatum]
MKISLKRSFSISLPYAILCLEPRIGTKPLSLRAVRLGSAIDLGFTPLKGMQLVIDLQQDLKVANVICMNGRRHIASSKHEFSMELVVHSHSKKKQALLPPVVASLASGGKEGICPLGSTQPKHINGIATHLLLIFKGLQPIFFFDTKRRNRSSFSSTPNDGMVLLFLDTRQNTFHPAVISMPWLISEMGSFSRYCAALKIPPVCWCLGSVSCWVDFPKWAFGNPMKTNAWNDVAFGIPFLWILGAVWWLIGEEFQEFFYCFLCSFLLQFFGDF